MSHFSTIDVAITDTDMLLAALAHMGFTDIATTRSTCRGYQGGTTTADIVVRMSNGYDIGFVKRGGKYAIVADWYGVRVADIGGQAEFAGRLQQAYALEITRVDLRRKGFSLVETRMPNGGIRVVARRVG